MSPEEADLHSAVHQGNLEIIKALLKDNVHLVNAKDSEGKTPLYWAANNGDEDVAALLLASKADVNGRTDDGWTPLHAAAVNNNKDMAAFLLANRADVNATKNDGKTPLRLASQYEHTKEVAASALLLNVIIRRDAAFL